MYKSLRLHIYIYVIYNTLYTPLHHYTYTPTHLHTYTPVHLYICTYIHLYTATPIHLYTYTPIHLYTYTPVHLYTPTHYSVSKPSTKAMASKPMNRKNTPVNRMAIFVSRLWTMLTTSLWPRVVDLFRFTSFIII